MVWSLDEEDDEEVNPNSLYGMARVGRCWWDYCSMLLSVRPTARFLIGDTTTPPRSIFFASTAVRRSYLIDSDSDSDGRGGVSRRFTTTGKTAEFQPALSATSSTTVDTEEVKHYREDEYDDKKAEIYVDEVERRKIDEERRTVLWDFAKEVWETIGRESEWEEVLLSLFPSDHRHHNYLYRTSCIRKVIESKPFRDDPQKQQHLTLRYFTWLSKLEYFYPNRSTFTSLFRVSLDAGAWKASMFAIRLMKFQLHPSFINPFVQLLCRNSAFEEVLEVVSAIKGRFPDAPSIFTWNTALRRSLRAGRTDLVWRFYEIMIGAGVSGNVFTFECLIEAFRKENRLLEAFRFLRQVCRSGFVPNVVSFNKLVDVFCKEGDFRKVSDVLHLMIAVGRPPNEYTYQSIIHELCIRDRADEAFSIFQSLKRRGYTLGVVMYSTVIDGLCKAANMADAHKLWNEMAGIGLESNSYTYAAFVDGYCRMGNLVEAGRLYSEMIGKGIEENTVTCTTLIGGFCEHGRMKEAVELFEEMSRKGIGRSVHTFNTLIRGFCNEGNTADGRNYFRRLVDSSVLQLQPNEASYVHLIKALCSEGNVDGATELFTDMENRGLIPSATHYDYMISGYCNVGKVDEGMSWLWKVINSNLQQPSELAFNELIHGLTVAGRIDDVFLVLDVMAQFGHSLKEHPSESLIHKLCGVNCSSTAKNRLTEILTAA